MRNALRAGVAGKLLLVCLACASCGTSDPGQGADNGGASGADSIGGSSHAGAKHSAGSGGRSESDAGAAGSDAEAGAGPTGEPPGLWYGGVSLCGFKNDQLQASAGSNPKLIVSLDALTAVSDVAFDASGNAWVVGSGSDDIFRFSAASLADPGSAEPDLVLSSSALSSPGNLTFDAAGALWVATRPPVTNGRVQEGSILRFAVPDGKSGMLSLSPAAQIGSTTEGDLNLIGNITFDSAQNLWVSSLVGLLRFDDPTKKKGTLALDPGAVIDKTGYSNNIHFYSVAFDSSGALWAASGDGLHYLTSITEFADPGSLDGRSSPEATATITGVADLLPAGGIAFDGSGNLWMARGNGLVMYSNPGALSGTVNPDPDLNLTVTGEATPSTSSHLLFDSPISGG